MIFRRQSGNWRVVSIHSSYHLRPVSRRWPGNSLAPSRPWRSIKLTVRPLMAYSQQLFILLSFEAAVHESFATRRERVGGKGGRVLGEMTGIQHITSRLISFCSPAEPSPRPSLPLGSAALAVRGGRPAAPQCKPCQSN